MVKKQNYPWMLRLIFLLLFMGGMGMTKSGAQTLNGSAMSLGGDCYEITSAALWQAGSVYFPDTLRLDQPFNILFTANFGSNDASGADGIVFVLQTQGANSIGTAGGNLGWDGVSPSFGVEFDTFENVPFADPAFDHVTAFMNGGSLHGSPLQIGSPMSALPNNGNLEDGLDHTIQINWNPANFRLEVWVDCNMQLMITQDLVNTVFLGNTSVFWGFAGATGGAASPHSICLLGNTTSSTSLAPICEGDSLALQVPIAQNGIYSWAPTVEINDPNVQNPQVWPSQNTWYVCRYLDPCGTPVIDSFYVEVIPPVNTELGMDQEVCPWDSVTLIPTTTGSTYLWSTGATSSEITVFSSGEYWVEVSNGGSCGSRDTIEVLFTPPPSVNLGPDTLLCGMNLEVALDASWPGATYAWADGSTDPLNIITESDTQWVEVTNGCATVTDTIGLVLFEYEEGYFIPNVFTPNGDGRGDTFLPENADPIAYDLKIYDRWGRQVFHGTDPLEGWAGTTSGKLCPVGVYYYVIRTRDCKEQLMEIAGNLSLIR